MRGLLEDGRYMSMCTNPPSDHAVVFEGPPGFTYEPGQHGIFRVSRGEDELDDAPGTVFFASTTTRSWTLAVHPSASRGNVVITVKRGTNASRRLHETMRPQAGSIRFVGVAGTFTPALSRSRPVLLIAGGIGVTPFRAMLPAFIAQQRPVALVYSVRVVAKSAFITELTTPRPGCTVTVTATGEPPNSAWTGRRGRVDAALLNECAPGGGGARSCDVFICGPPSFEEACRTALAGLGLSAANIFSESFDSNLTDA